MRQNISKEQWDELNDKEKYSFLLFLGYTKYFLSKYQPDNYRENDTYRFNNFLEKINIGQLIEFLGDDLYRIVNYSDNEWGVYGTTSSKIYYRAENLCDALWEATKHKINLTTQ